MSTLDQNLLNIEYQILEFIRAPDQTHKSFPPGYNSYRRLLMYRVGQRFRLSHTTVDASHEVSVLMRLSEH